jgi:kynurenine formamidase
MLPSYDQLPLRPDGTRCAWSCFSPDDNVGLIGQQTPDRILEASRLVRRGVIFPLGQELRALEPPLFGRARTEHTIIRFEGDPGFDDVINTFNPQASSQWDALAHASCGPNLFFNGATVTDVLERGRNTIDHWARRGIVGRGVLLDMEPVLGDLVDVYQPDRPVRITVDHLEACRSAAGVDYQPGDILMLHTGFLAWYLRQDQARRSAMAEPDALTAAGLEHSESMVRYLWDSHVAAVVSDNPAVEVWPPDEDAPFGSLHRILIGLLGMALGELWWLADLAADCRLDHVNTMLVTSAPLHVSGGVSSPANALAIK